MMKTSSSFSRAIARSLNCHPRPLHTSSSLRPSFRPATVISQTRPQFAIRTLSLSTSHRKGLSPESSDPPAPKTEAGSDSHSNAVVADITEGQYHEIADEYINQLLLALEEKAEVTPDIEVEYSAGVLTLTTPRGTYILNKQPPNKQIWLSSPVSGPKRFDWVTPGTNITQYEKQDSEDGDDGGDDGKGGKWIYLRDNSTLTDILRKEVSVRVKEDDEEEGFRAS